MKRGEIRWASLPEPAGRRPALVVTRDRAIAARDRVTVALLTTRIRGLRSEVPVGRSEGLGRDSVAACDNLQTIPKAALDPDPAGRLDGVGLMRLDRALRYALGIRH